MNRTHLDLFSGIGGFALAARWAGVETIGFAEIDDYASRVLAKNFPGVVNYGDVRNVPGSVSAWLITGGFPCQPFSVAGKQGGASDDRWLWPEMAGVIERVRPTWVLGENVPGIIRMELDTVLSDLERIGYAAWPVVIPAVGVDAPHRRERIWIVGNAISGGQSGNNGRRTGQELTNRRAHVADAEKLTVRTGLRTDEQGWQWRRRSGYGSQSGNVSDANNTGCVEQWRGVTDESKYAAAECGCWWQLEPDVGGMVDGVSQKLDGGGLDEQGSSQQTWSNQRPQAMEWQPEPNTPRIATGVKNRVGRLKGLGNAIVPQVAYQLIRMMIEAETTL